MTNSDDRVGIAIGVISRGTVSIKWMMYMRNLHRFFPPGMFWNYIVVEGKGYAEGRNEVIRKAKEQNFKWVLFIDDDVFLPENAVTQLLSRKKKIITGVYWTKASPSVPVIFRKMGEGPYFDFPVDEVFSIESGGIGATLIDMEVFDKFDEANVPYFKENWSTTIANGQTIHCNVGEDHWFYHNAIKLGYDVFADGNVLCEHYDVHSKTFYPAPEIVREYSRKALKKAGKEYLIEDNLKAQGKDPNKVTVAFLNTSKITINPDELDKRAVGGVESSLLYLSKALAKTGKFNVHVFGNTRNELKDGVYHHQLLDSDADLRNLEADYLVLIRQSGLVVQTDLKEQFNAKNLVLWMHDDIYSNSYNEFAEAHKRVDKIMVVSDNLKEKIMNRFNVPEDKLATVYNGVDSSLFNDYNKKDVEGFKAIYASTPYRGLQYVPKIMDRVREFIPDATIDVFSSLKIYSPDMEDNQPELFEELEKRDYINVHAPVPQKELAERMRESNVLLYPNIFEETSCIVAKQAVETDLTIFTNAIGALPETLNLVENHRDYILESLEDFESEEKFIDAFVESIREWYEDDSEHFRNVRVHDWDEIAELFQHVVLDNKNAMNQPDYWDNIYSIEKSHSIARLNTDFAKHISDIIKDDSDVLDFGCGNGALINALKKKNPNVDFFGCDISEEALEVARKLNKTSYFKRTESVDDIGDEKFDTVIFSHVLEHFENPSEILSEISKVLNSNGKIIILMPVNDLPWREHYRIWYPEFVDKLVDDNFEDYEILDTRHNFREVYYKNGNRFEEYMIAIKLGE